MKRLICIFLVAMILLGATSSILACTSFTVYEQRPIYGMNLDMTTDDVKFSVVSFFGTDCFYGGFTNDYFDLYSAASGMNNHGIFVGHHYLDTGKGIGVPSEGQKDMGHVLFQALISRDLDSALEMANRNELVSYINASQVMMADMDGNSYVVEPGVGNIADLNDMPNQVIANFSICNMIKNNTTRAFGAGADRYDAVCEAIDGYGDNFLIEEAFKTLDEADMTEGSYMTQYSMVGDPTNNKVYLALRSDYEKLWVADLETHKISTYKGFDTYYEFDLKEPGVHMMQLLNPDEMYEHDGDLSNTVFKRIWIFYKVGVVLMPTIVMIILVLFIRGFVKRGHLKRGNLKRDCLK